MTGFHEIDAWVLVIIILSIDNISFLIILEFEIKSKFFKEFLRKIIAEWWALHKVFETFILIGSLNEFML